MKVLLLASASLLLAAGAANAQDKPASPPAAASASASSSVTDAELSAVATVGAEGKRLQDEAAPGIAAATTPEDKRKAQYALDDKMEALFKANSITFERYNAIASMAQSDKALAAKIAAAPKTPMPAASTGEASPTSVTLPAKPSTAQPASPEVESKPSTDPGKGDSQPVERPAPPVPAGSPPEPK